MLQPGHSKPKLVVTCVVFKMFWLLQRRTREQLASSLHPMGIIGVVAEADWPVDALSLDEEMIDDVKLQSLDEVILEDGAKYVAIYGRLDYLEQVHMVSSLCCILWPSSSCTLDSFNCMGCASAAAAAVYSNCAYMHMKQNDICPEPDTCYLRFAAQRTCSLEGQLGGWHGK